ncbi:histidine kinase dimerization/phosphoacceptor domain -containing protein [Methanobacterium alcaliphilum]|uniref:histidine kinase dimerization/phosphoacceptor domain -containing protein n=1 Tax=Methanobacterium alcaliphilum TaxID=392018 RepID=UPI00200B058F|nr:histidine kinase dimerization/phosphoacceptor domain -containing protein [Methanobacterium alcaliphilum]MCK9151606.1 GAF domain-containing protein [Methanobacterium alcaliphilum]
MKKDFKRENDSLGKDIHSDILKNDLLYYALLAIPCPVFIFDINCKVTYLTNEASKEFDLDMEEAIGKKWSEIIFHLNEDFDSKLLKVFKSGLSHKDEIILPSILGNSYYEYVITPIKSENAAVERIMVTFWNITPRKADEELRKINTLRLGAMLDLYALSTADCHDLTDFALEKIVEITNSEIGYLSFLNDNEDVLNMYSWSQKSMKQCQIEKKPIKYEVKSTGLWGEAIRQRKYIITNDYDAPHILKKGFPEAHVTIRRHMNVPIFDGEKIVMLAGVGNKLKKYTEDDVNQITLLLNFLWSILKRKRSDEFLHNSLKEKEILLKEIHHRVKNNMQIVSSLLGLQEDSIASIEGKKALKETQTRVKSMAMIHEKLYESQDFSKVNVAEYIKSLTEDIMGTFRADTRNISLDLDLKEYFIKLESAIPLALIINELFTNTLKHAFSDGRDGLIRISIGEENGKITLIISDNGVGFPKNIDLKNTDTLGLQLVNSLVRQLEATLEFDGNYGTKFTIIFDA